MQNWRDGFCLHYRKTRSQCRSNSRRKGIHAWIQELMRWIKRTERTRYVKYESYESVGFTTEGDGGNPNFLCHHLGIWLYLPSKLRSKSKKWVEEKCRLGWKQNDCKMNAKYLDEVGLNKTKSKEAVIPEGATDEIQKCWRLAGSKTRATDLQIKLSEVRSPNMKPWRKQLQVRRSFQIWGTPQCLSHTNRSTTFSFRRPERVVSISMLSMGEEWQLNYTFIEAHQPCHRLTSHMGFWLTEVT